jgi:diguanylate cyclase (GGDEF)-like protein
MIDDDLTRRLADRQRRGTETSVLFLDLDGFKPVNDRHGHGTGDQLLVEVAARLAEASDPRASVVRMGGDEFLVLTPTDSLADALVMADTVLEQLRAPYRLATATVTVEASAGLLVTTPRLPWPPLVDRADQLLYEAKRDQGDRLAAASDV